MDAAAARIAQLAVEGCGVVGDVACASYAHVTVAEVVHLRDRLTALAGQTCDDEAADVACGVAGALDDLLHGSRAAALRGAA